MKKTTLAILLVIAIAGSFYLILPSPKDFPDLPNSIKSIEPGDTIQIANVSAYYTDMPRKEVVDYYFKYFSQSQFLGIPLITYKLNHPPERIKEVLRETQQTTFVEEIVHPFRESVFINGFEWNNDPFTSPKKRIKNILTVDGKTYQFKITVYGQKSMVWQRLIVFYSALIVFYLTVQSYKQLLLRWKKK